MLIITKSLKAVVKVNGYDKGAVTNHEENNSLDRIILSCTDLVPTIKPR